jgi:hypothetical protein
MGIVLMTCTTPSGLTLAGFVPVGFFLYLIRTKPAEGEPDPMARLFYPATRARIWAGKCKGFGVD